MGYVVPEGGGIVQTVQVLTGDAKRIEQSQRQIMDLTNALMAGAPSAGIKMNIKPMGPRRWMESQLMVTRLPSRLTRTIRRPHRCRE